MAVIVDNQMVCKRRLCPTFLVFTWSEISRLTEIVREFRDGDYGGVSQGLCRTCTDGVTQAPAPSHLIAGGLPTEGAIAHVLISKYADHLPLYRQSQILARAGLDLHRAVLADWVGKAAFHLKPVVDRLAEHLKRSSRLFMDETTAPVLDPGRGATKTGYLWALARDNRSWGGEDPPGVVYFYAPGRAGAHAETFLTGFDGILQIDGYPGYNRLTKLSRKGGAPIRVAHCWAQGRRACDA